MKSIKNFQYAYIFASINGKHILYGRKNQGLSALHALFCTSAQLAYKFSFGYSNIQNPKYRLSNNQTNHSIKFSNTLKANWYKI